LSLKSLAKKQVSSCREFNWTNKFWLSVLLVNL
jgi:hypothetical protein